MAAGHGAGPLGWEDTSADAPGVRRLTNRRQKVADLVAQEIVDDIVRRGLAPGTMLLPEKEMVAHFGVGRGTLREALHYLQIQGVLTIKSGPGGGPMVASPGSNHLAGTIGLLLTMKRTPFRHVVETRMAVEPMLAGLAAKNASDDLLEALERSVTEQGRSAESDRFWPENSHFHELIARGSGNDVFALVLTSLHRVIDGTAVGITYSKRRQDAIVRAHDDIARAIIDRDAGEATDAMSAHLRDWVVYLERHHAAALDAPVTWS